MIASGSRVSTVSSRAVCTMLRSGSGHEREVVLRTRRGRLGGLVLGHGLESLGGLRHRLEHIDNLLDLRLGELVERTGPSPTITHDQLLRESLAYVGELAEQELAVQDPGDHRANVHVTAGRVA